VILLAAFGLGLGVGSLATIVAIALGQHLEEVHEAEVDRAISDYLERSSERVALLREHLHDWHGIDTPLAAYEDLDAFHALFDPDCDQFSARESTA